LASGLVILSDVLLRDIMLSVFTPIVVMLNVMALLNLMGTFV
jgi:hypothetical protein